MSQANNISIILIIIMLTSTAFTTQTKSSINDALDDIINRGSLQVGMDVEYPPFEFLNESTNQVEGFDVEIGQIIADYIGVDLEIVPTNWDLIIPNLKTGEYDIILSAMTITNEREEVVDFSRWYYDFSQFIAVTNDNPKNIQTENDINSSDITIGVRTGSSANYLIDLHLSNSNIKTYANLNSAIIALENAEVDCVIDYYNILALLLVANDIKIVSNIFHDYLGIAVNTGEDNLLAKINTVLNDLLGLNPEKTPEYSMEYSEIYMKWFNVYPFGYNSIIGSSSSLPDSSSIILSSSSSIETSPITDGKKSVSTTFGFELIIILQLGILSIKRKKKSK